MRYPVEYVRYTARELRKIESRARQGEESVSKDQLPDILKNTWKALEEIADAIEGLQRSRD